MSGSISNEFELRANILRLVDSHSEFRLICIAMRSTLGNKIALQGGFMPAVDQFVKG